MTAQHTPGPWELIETQHKKIISSWHVKVGEHQIPVHPYKRIWSEDRTQSGLVIDHQHMADARLIAAAPETAAERDELLRVLQFVATDPCFRVLGSVTQEEVHAAIAKVTGQEGGAA